ncbi:hypothetical protein [Pseudomonas laurylsulfatiphila]|uniref:hypothetical protein n=1 Tax=Pseudomonas laurylsulfatiphila TaxID=2011015 RepID=UPI003D245A50
MRVRNLSEAPIMLNAFTNAGKMTTHVDGHGNKVNKPAAPQYTLICIPAEAEVEIDDELWLQATSGKTKVQVFEEEQEVIPGAKMDGKPVYQTVLIPTGKYRDVNLVQERVKKGDLEITVKVKSKLELADKIKALAGKKLVVTTESHTVEEIDSLYSTLCE